MKLSHFLWTTTLAFLLTVPLSANAEELPSCDELKGIVNALDELADALTSTENIRENSQLETSLGGLIDDMEVIARVENDDSLHTAVDQMGTIWGRDTPWEEDLPLFKMALDSAAMSLDRIYHKDCK